MPPASSSEPPADLPALPAGLRLTVSDRMAQLTLARPEVLNALSPQVLEGLATAARWLTAQPHLRVVVLAGEGRAFSAGADLAGFETLTGSGEEARAAADAGRRAADALEAIPAVTIARLQGRVVGGGVVLAACCDLRVAASDTVFSIPEVDLGIPLAWGGIPRLLREVGPAVTKDLVLTCRPFGAAEAYTIGFVSRVVAPDELDAEVESLAVSLAAKAALPVRATVAQVDAITRAMVNPDRAWSDADTLLSAIRDPECQQAAMAYLARVRGGGQAG